MKLKIRMWRSPDQACRPNEILVTGKEKPVTDQVARVQSIRRYRIPRTNEPEPPPGTLEQIIGDVKLRNTVQPHQHLHESSVKAQPQGQEHPHARCSTPEVA